MTIRRATEGDVELLAELGARMFRDAFAADNTPGDMADYLTSAFSPKQIATELDDPGSTFLIAYLSNEPVGYAKLCASAVLPCVHGARPVELARIYADQHVLGKGVGGALMQACLDEARRGDYATLWLGVWERNPRALRFYAKWGFQKVGTKTFTVGSDVQNDVVLARPVTQAP